MQTVAFDGGMGASGDMLLGALIGAGASPAALEPIEAEIDVSFEIDRRTTQGIDAVDVSVLSGAGSAEGHRPHRSYQEVVDIVDGMGLDRRVTTSAIDAFSLLAEAEAAVHGSTIESIHFHEVGADDAIADVTGTAALIADIAPDRVVTAPLSVGEGEVETSHGVYPIPPPAVAEIASMSHISLRGGPVEGELLTPTGAAILGSIAEPVERLPTLDVDAVGYGAGDRSIPNRPNVLRALVGSSTGDLMSEDIAILETHVDDASPEVIGHLQARLREVGARDVAVVPLTMKKSRPGHLIKVVARPADERRVARVLAAETGTLGVRAGPATHRWVADRSIETAAVAIDGERFAIDVKVATDDRGDILDVSAEYDEAAAVARRVDLPVREVMRLAESAVQDEYAR